MAAARASSHVSPGPSELSVHTPTACARYFTRLLGRVVVSQQQLCCHTIAFFVHVGVLCRVGVSPSFIIFFKCLEFVRVIGPKFLSRQTTVSGSSYSESFLFLCLPFGDFITKKFQNEQKTSIAVSKILIFDIKLFYLWEIILVQRHCLAVRYLQIKCCPL